MVEGREAQRAERARKGGDQSDSGAMDNSAQSIEGIEVVSVKLSKLRPDSAPGFSEFRCWLSHRNRNRVEGHGLKRG